MPDKNRWIALYESAPDHLDDEGKAEWADARLADEEASAVDAAYDEAQ